MHTGKILDIIDQVNEQFIIPYILRVLELLRFPHELPLLFQQFVYDLYILEMFIYINLFKLIYPFKHPEFRQEFIF